jgi:hypothetical protein
MTMSRRNALSCAAALAILPSSAISQVARTPSICIERIEPGEVRVVVDGESPTPPLTLHLTGVLQSLPIDRRIVVAIDGHASGLGAGLPAFADWRELFEQFHVIRVEERTDGPAYRSPPLRVGGTDPAGVVYESSARKDARLITRAS